MTLAGDWIPMRLDIARDTAVIQIADQLKMNTCWVVGALHRFWSWLSEQSTDGNITGVSMEWIDDYIGMKGFCVALIDAEWLMENPTGLSIPGWDHYLSNTAKARLLNRRRQQTFRKRIRNARSVTRSHVYSSSSLSTYKVLYDLYPKKIGRAKALVAIEKALDKITVSELLAKVKAYAASVEYRRGTDEWKFVPHPATWFNQERWADELEQQPDATTKRPAVRGASRIASRPGKYG